MHFLGGVCIGLMFLWTQYFFFSRQLDVRTCVLSVVGVLCVGAMWELFEFVVGARVSDPILYRTDTLIDLVMDAVGALASYVLFRFLVRTKSTV